MFNLTPNIRNNYFSNYKNAKTNSFCGHNLKFSLLIMKIIVIISTMFKNIIHIMKMMGAYLNLD